MNGIKLYFRYMRIHFLSQLQYRGWPLRLVTLLVFVASDPLDALLMFDRFGRIGDWTVSRVLLTYGLALMAYGTAEFFARGFDLFPWQVRTGAFDRIMLRPRSTVLQVLCLQFSLDRVGRMCGAAALIWLGLRAQGVTLDAVDWLILLGALAGGTMMYTGVFIVFSAITVFTVQVLDVVYIFTNGSYQVAKVPPELLPQWLRVTFLYILPMLAFCYYPAAAICGWGESRAMGLLMPLTGAVFLAASLVLWRFALAHYRSTGS